MNIQIPGYKTLDLSFLVLDYNGTIAVDGQIPLEVREALVRLSKDLQIHVTPRIPTGPPGPCARDFL